MALSEWEAIYKEKESQFIRYYEDLLSISSISTDSRNQNQMQECVNYLMTLLNNLPMEVTVHKTSGYPVIMAETTNKGEGPTLIIYNHYDVQPADPMSEWDSDPFSPRWKKNRVYARGASDNKGQLMYTYHALKEYCSHKPFPVHIKWIIEGEEESGSGGLNDLLRKKKKLFKADYILVVDSDIIGLKTPSISLGARGIISFEVDLINANGDLHSGSHGGIAYNPAKALTRVLSSLWDEEEKIAIEGMYNDVNRLTDEEKLLYHLEFDKKQYKKEFGVQAFSSELGYSELEANWFRPSLEINGMWSGYVGEGGKTIIPASAHAKLTCRLVPKQDPNQIAKAIEKHIKAQVPKGMECRVTVHAKMPAVSGNIRSPFVKQVQDSYTEVFGKPCVFARTGGSIPIIGLMQEVSGAEPLFIGTALDADHIHSPNESFTKEQLKKGFLVITSIIDRFSSNL